MEIEANNNLEPELGDIYSNIEDIANNEKLPKQRYNRLHLSKKLEYTPFEAKSKHLRVYLFHDNESGQIIICGGLKGDQGRDIKRVEKTIKEYTLWKLELKKQKKK